MHMQRHPALETLAGTWRTTGQLVADPSQQLEGTDSYEWYEGSSLLIHRIAVTMGTEQVVGLEVISYDEDLRHFSMHHFDATGRLQVSAGSFHDNTWTFTSASERGVFTFSSNGQVLSGTWEKLSDNSKWEPWLAVRLEKQ